MLYDDSPENPSFARDLKELDKKERGFIENVYRKHLVPFILACGRADPKMLDSYRKVSALHKEYVRQVSERKIIIENISFSLIKFRSTFRGKRDFGGGPRISFAVEVDVAEGKERKLIPLEAYTHGIKGSSGATDVSELKQKLKSVLKRL